MDKEKNRPLCDHIWTWTKKKKTLTLFPLHSHIWTWKKKKRNEHCPNLRNDQTSPYPGSDDCCLFRVSFSFTRVFPPSRQNLLRYTIIEGPLLLTASKLCFLKPFPKSPRTSSNPVKSLLTVYISTVSKEPPCPIAGVFLKQGGTRATIASSAFYILHPRSLSFLTLVPAPSWCSLAKGCYISLFHFWCSPLISAQAPSSGPRDIRKWNLEVGEGKIVRKENAREQHHQGICSHPTMREGLPWWLSVYHYQCSVYQCSVYHYQSTYQCRKPVFHPWIKKGKIP